MIMARGHRSITGETGFSLIELMIGMTLGVILLAGVLKVFDGANRSNLEIQKSAQLIGNGQYAMQVLGNELHGAGFYGAFYILPAAPATLPDPCNFSSLTDLKAALAVPVQAYGASDLFNKPTLPSGCAGYGLTAANVVTGSDVVVVRRADSEVLTAAPVSHEVYIQANSNDAAVQIGNPTGFALGALDSDNTVATVGTDASGQTATVLKRANQPGASPAVDGDRIAADIYKLHVTVYFVAPCSVPADGSDICTGAGDDGGHPIPTLKRLELGAAGGATTMTMASLVEGVERVSVDFGIDNSPAIASAVTNFSGDGVADAWLHQPALADWPKVVVARVHVLVRAPSITAGYTDGKNFAMGMVGTTEATNDNYKRHLFGQALALTNLSQRRQIPQ